jgi:biofilm PGA synthesis N-glycosyltransferase PgaC
VEVLFWFCLFVLLYCYFGYGLLLFFLNAVKKIFFRRKEEILCELLPVTLIVPAYNEEPVLSQKIKNCMELDYPRHLLNIFFITDGSTDGSEKIISKYDFITLLHQSGRRGKLAALKRAMQFVKTPVVIFSDANSMLNPGCIVSMVRHFANEKVGGVAGEKKILKNNTSLIGAAEGLYWKYESFMKQQDADFNTVVGASGELFSIRTELFHSTDDNLILDDFIFSIHVCLKGYKIEYEPGAFAMEAPSLSLADEEKRKIRIAAGAYQTVNYLKQYVNVFKYPILSLQYFSGRFLRWVFCPVAIVLLMATNVALVANRQGYIFSYLLLMQCVFYLLAILGRVFIAHSRRLRVLAVPFYFMFMNICLIKGFFNYIRNRQTILWEKSMREAFE